MPDDFAHRKSSQFDLERLRRCSVFSRVRFRATVGSTNDWALQEATAGLNSEEVVLFLTDRQTAGRGRYDRKWEALPGVLTFSLLYRLDTGQTSDGRGRMPLAIGCGISDALREIGLDAFIKWPNDIIVRDCKLAGVLVESVPGDQRVVIGCGINVNQAPAQVPGTASMKSVAGSEYDMTEVLLVTARHLLKRLSTLAQTPTDLIGTLNSRNWLHGKTVKWTSGASSETGRVDGIAEDGGLVLRLESGPRTVHSGTIRPLPNSDHGGFDS